MRTNTTSRTRRTAATLIALALIAVALFVSSDVGRTFTTRQLNERYSAEDIIGENRVSGIETNGTGTGGQSRADFLQQVSGAGEAAVLELNEHRSSADCQSQFRTPSSSMREARK